MQPYRDRKNSRLAQPIFLSILLIIAVFLAAYNFASPALAQDENEPPVDHSVFPQLQQEFATGPDVTRACLECHVDSGSQVMETTHWTWEYQTEDGQTVGKNNVINNYCVAVSSNWPRCTSCHVGYGYSNPDAFAAMGETEVDCLVCHDTTGTYKKFPAGAGHPAYEEMTFPGGAGAPYGKPWTPPDLAAVGQSVGSPGRANCGSCHFYGGGAANVKHGDLDVSMVDPSFEVDVHMDSDGLNFSCQTCHTTEQHQIAGSRYEWDLQAGTSLKTCQTCHADHSHETEQIDDHLDRVACQTCHIPTYAKEVDTKTYWDWSTAGELKDGEGEFEGQKVWIVEKDENGNALYHSAKGTFEWGGQQTPDYLWYNGNSTWITLDDELAPEGYTPINQPQGDINDDKALIFPMKSFYAIQPADAGTNTLAVPNLFPTNPDTAYWKNWDWNLALTGGQATVGREYSGALGWAETVMYWPITHQVAPADQALDCTSCHAEEGRLNFAELGYETEQAAVLMSFPPVIAESTAEPTATEAPPEPSEIPPTEAPTETSSAEPPSEPTGEAPGEETTPEESSTGLSTTTIILIGALVVGAIIFAIVLLRRNQE